MSCSLTDPDAASPTVPAADRRQAWPDALAFQDALQHPEAHVGCPELAHGRVCRGRSGLPLAYSGRFAVVFRIVGSDGRAWAFRCFTSAPERRLARALRRWQDVARYADVLPEVLLPARLLDRGVRVDGAWYPAVVMPWAPGEPLLPFVERHRRSSPDTLVLLADSLGRTLSRLEEAGVAHGDWQQDNLFVSGGGRTVTLVDYDGFYAPEGEAAGERIASEAGHPNYQHPGRRAEHVGVGSDRFACRVMRAALLALAREPSLWDRFGGDGESLLFRRADFLAPGDSRLFAEVRRLAEGNAALAAALAELESDCALPAPVLALPASLRPEVAAWARRRVPAPAAVPGGDGRMPLSYVERLRAMEASGAARRNRSGARAFVLAGGLALWASAALTGGSFLTAMVAASLIYWFLVGNYLAWPRKRVWDALHQEMGKLALEVAGLEECVGQCRGEDVRERTRASLRRVPISRALSVPGVRRETVRLLRASGIETAQDLLDRPLPAPIGGTAEEARLRLWCRESGRRLADGHARERSPERFRAGSREGRIAQHRRRIGELQAQCAGLGAAGLDAYLAYLLTGRAS